MKAKINGVKLPVLLKKHIKQKFVSIYEKYNYALHLGLSVYHDLLQIFKIQVILFLFSMNQEKFKINWQPYSANVTLVSEHKKQFKAHKDVLSACSSVFKSIISNSNSVSNSHIIYLTLFLWR